MPSDRRSFSVLLISDDDRMQRMTSWILVEEGFEVAVYAAASEAIKRKPPPAPDVVLLDAHDRIMREDAKDLRAAFPGARVAALHFHGAPAAEHVDAECHLHTPFHADELVQCVTDALAADIGAESPHLHP